MGWWFPYGMDKKGLIADLTRDVKDSAGNVTVKCIAKTVRGNVLWAVREYATAGDAGGRFIQCSLMRTDGERNWGSKDMDESMGPYEVSCPLSYLDMVPDPGGYATEWRERVRAHHARQNQKLTVGQTVPLRAGCSPKEVTITSLKPLKGTYAGITYRVARRYLANAMSREGVDYQ